MKLLSQKLKKKYYYKFDFTNKPEEKFNIGSTLYLLDITWSNGEKNKDEYQSKKASCSMDCYNYANYITNVNQLNLIGTTSNGDKIYELKNKETKVNPDDKESILKVMYDSHYSYI